MRRGMLFGIGVAVVLVGGGTAYSAIPSSDGAFHGCVNNATGVLRVIDTSKGGALGNCILSPSALKETPIAWNGQGVAGARGPAGPQGEAGAQGERGPAGPAITDLAELEGIACTVAGRTGTVHITVDTSGSISMNCAPVSHVLTGSTTMLTGWSTQQIPTALRPATTTRPARPLSVSTTSPTAPPSRMHWASCRPG